MYSMVTIVNNTVLLTWKFPREEILNIITAHKKRNNNYVMWSRC